MWLSVLDKISAVEENWRLEPLGSGFGVTVGWREATVLFRPNGAFQQWATVLPGSGHSLRFQETAETADLPQLVARDGGPVPGGSVTRAPDETLRVSVAGQDIWRVGPDRVVHTYQRPAGSGPDPAHQLYTWSQAPDGPGAPAGPGRDTWKESLAFVQHIYPLLREESRLAETLGSSPKQLRALLATESPADPGDRLWGRLRVLHYLATQEVEGGRITSASATEFDVVFDTGTSLRFTAGGQVVARRTDLPGSELHLLYQPPGAPPELRTASGSPAPQQWQTVLGDDGRVRVGLRSPDGGDGPVWQVSADGTLESFTRPAGTAGTGLFGRIAASGVLGSAAGGGTARRGQGAAAEVARRLLEPALGGTRNSSVPWSVGRAGGRGHSRLAPAGAPDTGPSRQVAADAATEVGAGVAGQASPAGPDPRDAAPAELLPAGMPATPVPGDGADPAHRLLDWLKNPDGPALEAWQASLALLETKYQANSLEAKARLLGMHDRRLRAVLQKKDEVPEGFKWRALLAAYLADSEDTGTGSEGTRNWHIKTDRKGNDYFNVVFRTGTMLEFRGGEVQGWSVIRPDHDTRVRFGYVPAVDWEAPKLTTLEGDEPAGVWELRVGADRRSVTVSDLSPDGERMPQWQLSPEQLPQPFAARHVPGGGADPAHQLLDWLKNPDGPELEAWDDSLTLLETTKHKAKSQQAKARLLGMSTNALGSVVRGKAEASAGFKWRVRLAAHLAGSKDTGNWQIKTDWKSRDYFRVVFGETTMLEFRGGNLLGWSVIRPGGQDMRVRFDYVPAEGWGEPELTTLKGDKPAGVWELRVGADRRGITVSDLSPGGEGRPQWQLSPEQLPWPFAPPPAVPGNTDLYSRRFGTGIGGVSRTGTGVSGHASPAGPDPRDAIPAGLSPVPVPGGGADPAHQLLDWLENPDRPGPGAWNDSLTLLETTKHKAKSLSAKAMLLGMNRSALHLIVQGKREASAGFKWRVRLAAHLANSKDTDSEGTRNWHIKTDRRQGDYFNVVFGETTMLEFRGGNLLGWSVIRPGGQDMRVRFDYVPAEGWGEPELTTLKGDKPAGVWELRVGADRRGITVSDLSPGGERMPQWQLGPEQLPPSFALPPAVPGDTDLFGHRFGTGVESVSRAGTGPQWRVSPAGTLESFPPPPSGTAGGSAVSGPAGAGVPDLSPGAASTPAWEAAADNPQPGGLAGTGLPGRDPGLDPFHLSEPPASAEADTGPSYLHTINWTDVSPP